MSPEQSGAEQADDSRMIIDLVAKFVDQELMPLEAAVIAREIKAEPLKLLPEEEAPLLKKCKELGLWALDAPEELGGANLSATTWMALNEELGRTVTPFVFPPDSPNMHMLLAVGTPEIKVYATEMAAEVIDHAMQTLGAMGVTKELPLQLMAQHVRVMRVYEGPSEVHRMSIAKKILKETR